MAEVKFKRKTQAEMQNLPIDDGSFIVEYETPKAYIDIGNQRKQFAGGSNVLNEYSESTTEPYSANYANNNVKSSFTSLYSGAATSGTITLSDSIQNYDFILIGIQASGFSKSSMLIPVSDIVVGSGTGDTYEIAVMQNSSVYVSMQLKFITNTTLEIMSTHEAAWTNPRLKYVIGIKL